MQSKLTAAVTVALGLAACAPGQAGDTVPKTYAEAAAELDLLPIGDPNWPSHRTPPGNVRAEDMAELFGDRVLISELWDITIPGFEEIKVVFMGADGRYAWCAFKDHKRAWFDHVWRAELRGHTGIGLVPLVNPHIHEARNGGLSPLYDGQTGEIVFYTLHNRDWWDWNRGHLQERLPAVTWELCPDFPSAEELGVEVNTAQTATTYDALVAQDPGRRVLRPDLVTTNAIALYNREQDE